MTRAKKRLGQHFLADHVYIDRILGALNPQVGENIVEIGPGRGALTLPLLRQVKALTAIELDRDLIPLLQREAVDIGQLSIIEQDVLHVSLAELGAISPVRLVGNLPYYISSPILFHCLQYAEHIRDMHFMLQKEVVERMAAAPGSRVYGRLSVMLQLRCHVIPLFDVPPEAFLPPPAVMSAVVRLAPLTPQEKPAYDPHKLDTVVKAAFGKRRKTLNNALKGLLTPDDMQKAGIDPGARAETVSPAGYVALAQCLPG